MLTANTDPKFHASSNVDRMMIAAADTPKSSIASDVGRMTINAAGMPKMSASDVNRMTIIAAGMPKMSTVFSVNWMTIIAVGTPEISTASFIVKVNKPRGIDTLEVTRPSPRMHRLHHRDPIRLRERHRVATLRIAEKPDHSRQQSLPRRVRAALLFSPVGERTCSVQQRPQHRHVTHRHRRAPLRHLLLAHRRVLPEQVVLLRLPQSLHLHLLLHLLLRLLLALQLGLLRTARLHGCLHLLQLVEELRQVVDNRGNRVVLRTGYASRPSRRHTVFDNEAIVVFLHRSYILVHAFHQT